MGRARCTRGPERADGDCVTGGMLEQSIMDMRLRRHVIEELADDPQLANANIRVKASSSADPSVPGMAEFAYQIASLEEADRLRFVVDAGRSRVFSRWKWSVISSGRYARSPTLTS